jgi:hypothetical protein
MKHKFQFLISSALIISSLLSSCAIQSTQSAVNKFRDYQKENQDCKYFAGAVMTGGAVDEWGYDEFGGAQFGCGNTMEEAKKNAINSCEYDTVGLLGKLTEVIYLGLLDFPCKIAFTEVNSNPVYKFEGSKKECEKLGYKEGTDKYKKCLDTLSN